MPNCKMSRPLIRGNYSRTMGLPIMEMKSIRISEPLAPHVKSADATTADVWFEIAEEDNRICRLFERRHNARLSRSSRSQRVAWEVHGENCFGVLLPDLRPPLSLKADEWYLFHVSHELLLHRSIVERELVQMIILPETAEDWVELLRQSTSHMVFDLRFEVTPQYINALGEIDNSRCGFQIVIEAYAPNTNCRGLCLSGIGGTPEAAARDACCKWLECDPISLAAHDSCA